MQITEEQVQVAATWANEELSKIGDAETSITAQAIVNEAFRKLLPQPILPTLPKESQAWIEGWAMGVVAGATDGLTDPLHDAALMEEIEPLVNCEASEGELSEKRKLLDEIWSRIQESRKSREELTSQPTPSKGVPKWLKHCWSQEREQLELAWLDANGLSPEVSGVVLSDFQIGPEGLVGEPAIQAWTRVRSNARRELQKTHEGRQLIAHIENHPKR